MYEYVIISVNENFHVCNVNYTTAVLYFRPISNVALSNPFFFEVCVKLLKSLTQSNFSISPNNVGFF